MKIISCFLQNGTHQCREEAVHPRIIKLRSHRADNRQIFISCFKQLVVAFKLFTHIPDRVKCSPLIKFIYGNQVREVQHVDLFKLCCRTKFRGHYIEGYIAMIGDLCIRLPDAGCFDNDQFITCSFANIDRLLNIF